jgi:hypothetical protein
MRFPFAVKHNGKLYEAGLDVPIGKEPVKEIEKEDKTASELSKELKEKYGIDMAPQMGKAKLQKALDEAEKKAKEEELKANELEPEEDEELEDGEEELEDEDSELDGEEEEEPEDIDDGEPNENDDESFLEKIINE